MKIYFLRHGERGHGTSQDTLTHEGVCQSKKAADSFKSFKIDKIICGTSDRAKSTLKPFLAFFKGAVEYSSEVNEQNIGIFQGKSASEWRKAVLESGKEENEFRPLNGESRMDAYNRAVNFFNRLKKEQAENFLIISHAGFISDMATLLLNEPMENAKKYKSSFCSVTFFEVDSNMKVLKHETNKELA